MGNSSSLWGLGRASRVASRVPDSAATGTASRAGVRPASGAGRCAIARADAGPFYKGGALAGRGDSSNRRGSRRVRGAAKGQFDLPARADALPLTSAVLQEEHEQDEGHGDTQHTKNTAHLGLASSRGSHSSAGYDAARMPESTERPSDARRPGALPRPGCAHSRAETRCQTAEGRRPAMRLMRSRIRKMKKSTFAMPAAVPARPVNPKTAAMTAKIKKKRDQLNMTYLHWSGYEARPRRAAGRYERGKGCANRWRARGPGSGRPQPRLRARFVQSARELAGQLPRKERWRSRCSRKARRGARRPSSRSDSSARRWLPTQRPQSPAGSGRVRAGGRSAGAFEALAELLGLLEVHLHPALGFGQRRLQFARGVVLEDLQHVVHAHVHADRHGHVAA